MNKREAALGALAIFLFLCLPPARPVLLSDNVEMLNHAAAVTAVLPSCSREASPVSLCGVTRSNPTHQYATQEPRRSVYPCVPPVFYHRQLRVAHVNELGVSGSFLSVSRLFHLLSESPPLDFSFTAADYTLKFDNRVNPVQSAARLPRWL